MSGLVQEIPEYLKPYIVQQDPALYTPIDQASWRFILKISQDFFAKYAHKKYLDGLKETGISIERIPLISEMDEALKRFGWRAVAVSGFIPPAVFMEFLSLGILPIACDMRSLEHLSYTPAPDVVHEAAGHAPIVADPDYARYLRSYGEISRKAISSSKDMDVYNAIRVLSDVKEDPVATIHQIQSAEEALEGALKSVKYVSEATLLSRMGWWTFEYGMVGSMEQPKIYGAGLLSSMGESFHCLSSNVKKIPFSLHCVEMDYDITRPQPQLYVAKSFESLTESLDKLADQMAFRIGGLEGLGRAREAATVTTIELNSGVQISGVLMGYRVAQIDKEEKPYYLQFKGPTQISSQDTEIPGQGPDYHKEGFSSPIGLLADGRSPCELTEEELQSGSVKFASGVEVRGKFKSMVRRDKTLIAAFTDCTVTAEDEILFQPGWGVFDMVCGENVVSVFGGAADRKSYLGSTGGFHQEPGKQKTNLTKDSRALNELYKQVRDLRETDGGDLATGLTSVHRELDICYGDDWLLRWEILELASARKLNLPFESKLRTRLAEISKLSLDRKEMIERGLKLIK